MWLWALGVLVSGLGVTLLATLWVWRDGRERDRERDRERFTRLAEAEWAALETRIEADEHVLKGLAGYFDERATVDTNQWRHQLELINPRVNHSELAEIGFAFEGHWHWQPVPPQDVMARKLVVVARGTGANQPGVFPGALFVATGTVAPARSRRRLFHRRDLGPDFSALPPHASAGDDAAVPALARCPRTARARGDAYVGDLSAEDAHWRCGRSERGLAG